MLKTLNLGDFTATATGTAVGVGHLEPGTVYGSVDGTFSGTMQIEISFDGSTYEQYGADITAAKTSFGPLPYGVKLVRGKCSAFSSGTIKVRAGGNIKRNELPPVGESIGGKFGDIVPTVASQSQTITCVSVANIAAGGGTNDKFTVTVGSTTVTFEYKKDGDFAAGAGRTTIDVSADTTDADVAATTGAAIAAAFPTATVGVAAAVITVTAPAGSTVIFTENVANAGFKIGAVNYGVPVAIGGTGIPQVWITSADFVGTYVIQHSFDGGETWASSVTPVTVSSGATSTLSTLPSRATTVRVGASTYTSGTLSARYGAAKETQV